MTEQGMQRNIFSSTHVYLMKASHGRNMCSKL
jgi:hypothetical protein